MSPKHLLHGVESHRGELLAESGETNVWQKPADSFALFQAVIWTKPSNVPGDPKALFASRLQRGWHFHYHVLMDSPANAPWGIECSSYAKISRSAAILLKQLPVPRSMDTPGWNKLTSLWASTALATRMNRALPGDLPQKGARQSLRCPLACQWAPRDAGSDTGLYMPHYTDFTLTVKQVKTHLSITYYTR